MRYGLKVICLFLFVMVLCPLHAQILKHSTRPFVEEVKTLQTIVDGGFMKLPVIDMEGNSSIEISFDYLSDEQPWLAYHIVHCDADWHQDDLGEMDYVEGFFPVKIEDVQPSFNTFVSYYHYSVKFPNEDVKLTASGNYAVLIHPEDDEDNVIAVATFSVSEQIAFAKGEVSGNTDIDFLKTHQQLSFDVSWGQSKLPYLDPASDLKIVVRQNRREDTKRVMSVPTCVESGKAVFEHNRDLIFDAGNNYRRFEFTDLRYATIGVENIRYEAPYYCVNLRLDAPRNTSNYLFDKDQNGRYLVRALRVSDQNVEAEYFKARFTLKADVMFSNKGIYLSGDFTYGQYSDEFRMEYDDESGLYWKDVILKQGSYNYIYAVDGIPSVLEGDFHEAENEYDIYIYYRPNGARYDRLLGVADIASQNK